MCPQGDGDKRARSPGRARRKALKPLARGMPGYSGVTVVTTLVCFFTFAREAAGATSARHSLRPPISGRKVHARLGRGCVARTVSSCPDMPPSLKLRRPSELLARRSLGGDGIRASIIFTTTLSKKMDHRVKPGDDGLRTGKREWLFENVRLLDILAIVPAKAGTQYSRDAEKPRRTGSPLARG